MCFDVRTRLLPRGVASVTSAATSASSARHAPFRIGVAAKPERLSWVRPIPPSGTFGGTLKASCAAGASSACRRSASAATAAAGSAGATPIGPSVPLGQRRWQGAAGVQLLPRPCESARRCAEGAPRWRRRATCVRGPVWQARDCRACGTCVHRAPGACAVRPAWAASGSRCPLECHDRRLQLLARVNVAET